MKKGSIIVKNKNKIRKSFCEKFKVSIMSQYMGDAQPYEDYEADYIQMQKKEKANGNDVLLTSTPKRKQCNRKLDLTSTPKKKQCNRKLDYSPSTTTSPKKKKMFKPAKKQLANAPKKVVCFYSRNILNFLK